MIELNPKDPDAYGQLAYINSKMGDYDLAIENCNKAIELGDDDEYSYGNRGNAYLIKGKYDFAIADFDKAISKGPSSFSENGKGELYYIRGEFDLAVKQFDKTLKIKKSSYPYLNKILICKETNKEADIKEIAEAAEKYLKQEIEKNKEESSNYSFLAEINCEAGIKLDESLQMAEKAVELEANGNNYYALGLCRYKKGDVKKAIECLKKAIKLKHMNTWFLYRLGCYYKESGNKIKAKEIWMEGLKINPVHRLIKAELEKLK
ncbi:MAG: hypothetical protein A2452_11490 [Candidatus Firestonebacteria bacterium RIFOXYC2_FULL_39_67]|nr:MAG: hypothetical protein A2536_09865 [Candidatus Firestonebacteria bacterium RIFOXYD2_FULL_39_29]OGF54568.1 MAG: hypothetical protein A2452_11490 [Candidatus Firestonebacteria bacterium RIFOXYC2_FULL_39_67]OGF56811.1 MAG: hypothetical protein A2497_07245 [Candidatus Firestonebacteria bacterium RifOxyC12_full_39_7]